MNLKKMIRDPQRVKACLKELPDGRLVTTKPLKMHIPARFTEKGMAELGVENTIAGIYGLILDDTYYASSTVNAMMKIEPSSTTRILVEGEEYIEFGFDAGSTVITNVNLVQSPTFVFRIYDELIAKGHVPWYLGYLQMCKIFATAKKHAGANIGENFEVTELLASIVARDAKYRHKYYRATMSSLEDLLKNQPAFIPLRSVQYAANSTLNKLAGSYFADATISALVSPSTKTERIESLLRK